MSLVQRVVVISGATGGAGRVAVQQFAAQGAQLVLLSTNPAKLTTLANELALSADQYLAHALDASDPEAAQAAAAAVMQRFGRVDVLINVVGGWVGGKSIIDGVADDLTKMLDQHLWTTLYLAQAFVPHLIANQWGRVIVISSPSATHPGAKSGPYSVAKAAQEALILTLAQELKGTGVTANILQVRTIDTKHERQQKATNASWTTPEEIAATMLYLCSDAAQVINGTRIPLTSGF